jgi:hypothetical protein
MRRRLFNLFAFACLAFALYLIVFVKDEPTQHIPHTVKMGAATASLPKRH